MLLVLLGMDFEWDAAESSAQWTFGSEDVDDLEWHDAHSEAGGGSIPGFVMIRTRMKSALLMKYTKVGLNGYCSSVFYNHLFLMDEST